MPHEYLSDDQVSRYGRFVADPNPEELAYGRDGLPARPLYRVRFRLADVWPGYAGSEADCVEVEVYEHWLEPP